MLTDARAPAVLARVPLPPVRADAAAPALYTLTALSTVRHFFLTARAAAAGCASAGCCDVLLSSLAPRPDASPPMASPPFSSPHSRHLPCKDCGGLAWWGLLLVDAVVLHWDHDTQFDLWVINAEMAPWITLWGLRVPKQRFCRI